MEKIQAAIAKARAERAATPGGAQAATPTSRAPAPRAASASDALAAQWDALPARTFDADLMRRNRIVSHLRGQEGLGIDMMRTRVLQQMRANNWRSLAITSPTAACGKTTIALNLAVSLSHQKDIRTLLLELDLRRPSLAKMLKIEDRPVDFAEVLRDGKPFADNAVRFGRNLAVGVNRKPVRDASELLGSTGLADTLSDIDTLYRPDITLFDMPPMLAIDDMMAFASHVDCVLIIAAAEQTTIKEIDSCEQQLAQQTNVMGIILNECRYMGPEAAYDY